jgi:peptidoglycan hydrolase-like protein with peptidoglycan-binding domain
LTEIQTALKNANFYTGSIDGKIGPKTKAAIEEFQKANGLTADGKVGPKTWQILGAYLNQALPAAE